MVARKTYYGNVAILRGRCPDCLGIALIIHGAYACCGLPVESKDIDDGVERISVAPEKRYLPPPKDRRAILKKQNGHCIYCGVAFGSEYFSNGIIHTVMVQWDHFVPFSYGQDNQPSNFVASCRPCNNIKHNAMFNSIDEARIYIIEAKIAKVGIS